MYMHNMTGWDWVWGSFVMVFWAVVIALVVYVAVRLARGDDGRRSRL